MGERVVTQVEAARLAGCSRDTIARARRAGRFPGAHLDQGRWVIPTTDLTTAGFLEPAGGTPAPPAAGDVERGGGEEGLLVALARAETRVAGLEDLVARQDDELRFLRTTVQALATRGVR